MFKVINMNNITDQQVDHAIALSTPVLKYIIYMKNNSEMLNYLSDHFIVAYLVYDYFRNGITYQLLLQKYKDCPDMITLTLSKQQKPNYQVKIMKPYNLVIT
jgi:hypothetical protein